MPTNSQDYERARIVAKLDMATPANDPHNLYVRPRAVHYTSSPNYERNLFRIMLAGVVAAIILTGAVASLVASNEQAMGTCTLTHSADVCEWSMRP